MNNTSTVAFHTLGCKLNFSETSTIGRLFSDAGYRKVDFNQVADVYVINTCSVTENADKECRQIVNKAKRLGPKSRVIIVGCFAQLKPDLIAAMDGVDMVLGASEKFNIVQHLHHLNHSGKTQIKACEISDVNDFIGSYSAGDRTRSFLKAQDGCDYSCSFCTIPLARGASRSGSVSEITEQAINIATTGVREIVLTGVNLGDFGKNNRSREGDPETFLMLIKSLENVDIPRIRISSIEPNLLTDEIIDLVASSSRFVPHFHIPLQSGSDKTLRRMRRRYLSELYISRIRKIKEVMPHCCIGADVITGFPGETHVDFLESYNFINSLDLSYLHVFTYSERDNTLASDFGDVVPISERKQRTQMLRILSTKKLRHFYEKFVGLEMKVLFENDNKGGLLHGFTSNYIRVATPFNPVLVHQIVPVKLTGINPAGEMLSVPVHIPKLTTEVHKNEPAVSILN
jgi:threonylcarbamoyladenosine tRNA methylthiotransferase MtaB